MVSVTVTVPNTNWVQGTPNNWFWNPQIDRDHVLLGSQLSAGNATNLYLATLGFNSTNNGSFLLQLSDGSSDASDAGPDFSDDMEQTGTIRFVASNGSELVLTTTGGDSTEPYNWAPSNATQYRAFSATLIGLADKSLTITFDFTEETRDSPWSELLGDLTHDSPWSELDGAVTEDSFWSPFISEVTINSLWSTLLGDLTEDGLWSGLSGTVTATGDWSSLIVTTHDSQWSELVSAGQSVDGAWSAIAGGLETTTGEWSDPGDSSVTSGLQVDFLATPDMPSDLDDGAGMGFFSVDFDWEGEPTHVALYRLRARWITRMDGRASPAPPRAEAELWASSDLVVTDQGDFQYIDTFILDPDMATSGNVMVDDYAVGIPRFAPPLSVERSIWVMARLEVDPAIKAPP